MELIRVKRTDPLLIANMRVHYSQPRGFVGRNRCFAIVHNGITFGHIVSGSSTHHLKGRDEYFGIPKDKSMKVARAWMLRRIVNNIFFHIEPVTGKYPLRNFAQKVLQAWRERAAADWKEKYNENVLGFESLVELPRTGECYLRDGWTKVGLTKGFTCKRTAGRGTDSWSGKRVWNTNPNELRPKIVFVRLR